MDQSYDDLFKDNYRGDERDNLVQRFISFAEGEVVVGELLGMELKTISKDKPKVKSYTVMTDDGPGSFLLGGATDKQLEGKLEIGDLLCVKYLGKQKIKGGQQQVNLWDIKHVPKSDWKAPRAVSEPTKSGKK